MTKFNPDFEFIGELLSGSQDSSKIVECLSFCLSKRKQETWHLESDSAIKAASKLLLLSHINPRAIQITMHATNQLGDSSLSVFLKAVVDKPFRGKLHLDLQAHHDSFTPLDENIVNLESAS